MSACVTFAQSAEVIHECMRAADVGGDVGGGFGYVSELRVAILQTMRMQRDPTTRATISPEFISLLQVGLVNSVWEGVNSVAVRSVADATVAAAAAHHTVTQRAHRVASAPALMDYLSLRHAGGRQRARVACDGCAFENTSRICSSGAARQRRITRATSSSPSA